MCKSTLRRPLPSICGSSEAALLNSYSLDISSALGWLGFLDFFPWRFFPPFENYMSQSPKMPEPAWKPVSEDAILKVSKEIVVKFIEVGRLAPSNFDEMFRAIYHSVRDTVRS
jgi:hypothetical protein